MLAFLLRLSCARISMLWGGPHIRWGHGCPSLSGATLVYGWSVVMPVESVCASHSLPTGRPRAAARRRRRDGRPGRVQTDVSVEVTHPAACLSVLGSLGSFGFRGN